jgi:hypothetical protein
MFIIPRTPLKRSRENVAQTPDIYDKFIHRYLESNSIKRSVLIELILDFVEHPVYAHLFNTMNADNVHHIMGYLRSQQSVKMNFILNHLLNNNTGGGGANS